MEVENEEDKNNEDEELKKIKEEECSICYDKFKKLSSDFCSLPCGHHFHASCLLKAIEKGYKLCPLCREILIKEEKKEDEHNQTQNTLSLLLGNQEINLGSSIGQEFSEMDRLSREMIFGAGRRFGVSRIIGGLLRLP
jgi:Ring finger domain